MNISALLEKMSLEEQVGQMFMLAFAGKNPEQIRILLQQRYVGGGYISQDNAETPEDAQRLSLALQRFASETPHRIPLILGTDQEGAWGVLVPHSTTGPGNLALGAAHNPDITRQMYQVIGAELRAVGYNTLLAPCADVNSNPRNPIIGPRSFGEHPQKVAEHVAAAVHGARAGGVLTTVKHFPGHGDTGQDSHRGLPSVDRSRAELDKMDLFPFRAGVQAGVDIVMTSHILYPAWDAEYPATLSRSILQDLLRRKIGFQGVILSDSMNMGAMRHNYAPDEAAILAVLAGIDMIMLAEEHYDHNVSRYIEKQIVTIEGVVNAVKQGRIPLERIRDAVGRILALKEKGGLFAAAAPSVHDLHIVGGTAHQHVAAQAAESAMTVMRDTSHLWPLPKGEPIILINAAPSAAYKILTQTRGIGPNQAQSAFEVFEEELLAQYADVKVFRHDQLQASDSLPPEIANAKYIVVITEDYPLPGTDFDTNAQKILVKRLEQAMADRMAIIGFRPPYELAEYPQVSTYISAFSSRACAAKAAVRAALGQIVTQGVSPVSIGV